MLTGGEYFAVIEIATHDETDKTSVSAKMSASGLFGVVSASGKFTQVMQEIAQNHTLRVTSFQQGGQGDQTTVATTAEAIIQKAATFGSTVAGGAAAPYAVLLEDYKTLNLPAAPNFIDLENARTVMEYCAERYKALMLLLNKVEYILEHQSQFVSPDVAALNEAKKQLTGAINIVKNAASKCADKVEQCAIPQFTIPEIPLPTRKGAPTSGRMIISPAVINAIIKAKANQKPKLEYAPRLQLNAVLLQRGR